LLAGKKIYTVNILYDDAFNVLNICHLPKKAGAPAVAAVAALN
jgi:hypothetical protein